MLPDKGCLVMTFWKRGVQIISNIFYSVGVSSVKQIDTLKAE
jgi:hypothetical protein